MFTKENGQALKFKDQASAAMTTIASLNSLRETSRRAERPEALTSAWAGEMVVATAWLAVYVVIVALTINSEPLSRAIEIVARN